MFDQFLNSFCFPDFVSFAVAIGIFGFSYILYLVLLLAFRKIFIKESLFGKIIESLKWPVLLILIEISISSFSKLFISGEQTLGIVKHTLVIFILATLGWILGAVVKTSFSHYMGRLSKETPKNHAARSILTQIFFLYRLIMLVIVVLTLSSILMTFPFIRTIGIGILGSAGILGIALGIAARPIFLNIMAGFQIALTKTIKIGDAVFLEGEFCRIESMHLTHVVARTWDLRRHVVPISYFVDKSFQNWDLESPELIAPLFFYCDYTMPVDVIRNKVEELLHKTPLWNRKTWKVEAYDMDEQALQLRISMSTYDIASANELKCYMREKLLAFIQQEYPNMLPAIRYAQPSEQELQKA